MIVLAGRIAWFTSLAGNTVSSAKAEEAKIRKRDTEARRDFFIDVTLVDEENDVIG
jgi:hypothetical protein